MRKTEFQSKGEGCTIKGRERERELEMEEQKHTERKKGNRRTERDFIDESD